MQTRDRVDDVGEDGAHHKRVASGCDHVHELDIELTVVVDDPAADAGAGCGLQSRS